MEKRDIKILTYGTVIGLILVNIFLIPSAFRGGHFNALSASQYGSFVGGYVGALFSFLSMIILYLTLRNQNKSSELDKFESKFFELIKLHRDNVSEISITNSSGRKVFVTMLREYREVFKIVNIVITTNQFIVPKNEVINIAYLVFFYGVGPNSSRVLRNSLSNYDENLVNEIVLRFENCEQKEKIKQDRNFNYVPFEGHQSRLGHYFRHLYQSVMYVEIQKSNINKYSYVKILRAQLSTHEQALLFINSLSILGHNWKEENLIQKYRLIKNLPQDFFDGEVEINLKDIYPNLKFEWEE